MLDALLAELRFKPAAGFAFYQAIYLGEEQAAESIKLALLKTKVSFRPNVVISMGTRPADLARYVDDQLAALKRAPHYRVLERRTLDGVKASFLVRQTFRNDHGVGVEQLQLYVALDDTRVLVVTATHLPGEDFQHYESLLQQMMASLEWLPSAPLPTRPAEPCAMPVVRSVPDD